MIYLPFAVFLALVLSHLSPIDGAIGHDYFYVFTRFFLGSLHFAQNHFDVPHYTAALCGGIPVFADPQSMYYSVPQFLALFLSPLTASLITIVFSYLVGYWGFLKICRELFHFEEKVSHLCALLFVLNGFAFAHLFVGHLTHYPYLFFPILLFLVFRNHKDLGRSFFKDLAAFSLLLISMFYGGSVHMLILFAVCLVTVFPFLIFYKLKHQSLKQSASFLGLAALLVVLGCAGKLYASSLYSVNFLPRGLDESGESVFEIVMRHFWFSPSSTPKFILFGKWRFGAWEYIGFVSKLTIPALLYFVYHLFRKKDRQLLLLSLASFIVLSVVCLIAAGNPVHGWIPFVRNYHNPLKFLGALIPGMLLLTAYVLNQWRNSPRLKQRSEKDLGFLYFFMSALLLFEYSYYANYFVKDRLGISYKYETAAYTALTQAKALTPVQNIIELPNKDLDGLYEGSSSLKCYEPAFGYRLEALHTKLSAGPTTLVRDGSFNLTHPGCLLYPDFFKCQRWDRIAQGDQANFDRISKGLSPDWALPNTQSHLLLLSLVVITSLLAVFAVTAILPKP